ncbi:proto-oncogene c-Fos-like isoform X2 [Actinia tenebrosa]|uniref:Proto-oncogene c-Fos-like isoform X2 n=1 Tax=Actinia tenebrosa TaxID=6105 RepID=A0A6P8H1G0_ACTTE|nr:proto-oncogene c-Fos-like isoform X2 [Actinia tenebrosa]
MSHNAPISSKNRKKSAYSRKLMLSEYDEERRRIRRERNKEAANRCRKKRREKIEVLEKIASELQQSNKSLENDIAEMRKEVKELEGFLENHQCNIAAT